jgi:hypothetical protein
MQAWQVLSMEDRISVCIPVASVNDSSYSLRQSAV